MAALVESAIFLKRHALIEAGTGTGKTLAYAVPAFLSRKRTVISTATIGLQTQIIRKDLPFLEKQMWSRYKMPMSFAIVKGKSNYVCGVAVDAALADSKTPIKLTAAFKKWAAEAQAGKHEGDKTDLGDAVPDEWSRLTADDCVGMSCPFVGKCGFMAARRAITSADILVANHAVVGLDLALSGPKSQNPLTQGYEVLVLDEAHKAADYIRNAFAMEATTDTPTQVARGMDKRGISYSGKDLSEVIAATNIIFGCLPTPRKTESFAAVAPIHVMSPKYRNAVASLEGAVSRLLEAPRGVVTQYESKMGYGVPVTSDQRSDYFASRRAVRRLTGYTDAIRSTVPDPTKAPDTNKVTYVTADSSPPGNKKSLTVSPVSVGPFLRATLYKTTGSVIATSATISVSDSFQAIKEELGLDTSPELELKVKSPFDYKNKTVLYISTKVPEAPKDFRDVVAMQDYTKVLAQEINDLATLTAGRAFVLFTSRAELEATFNQLMTYKLNLLRQDEKTTVGALIQKYREEAAAGRRPVLLGLKSFWEGVSVEGDDLSCVIITKLPFPSQSDPVYQALCAQAGDEAFGRVTLPAMIKDLQQGTGRLIRTTTDVGVVAILDGRVATKAYGKTILRSLPFTARSTDFAAVKRRYQEIVSAARGSPTKIAATAS